MAHYTNMPMQYAANLKAVKMIFFQLNNFNSLHISAQNIDCRYMLEPLHYMKVGCKGVYFKQTC